MCPADVLPTDTTRVAMGLRTPTGSPTSPTLAAAPGMRRRAGHCNSPASGGAEGTCRKEVQKPQKGKIPGAVIFASFPHYCGNSVWPLLETKGVIPALSRPCFDRGGSSGVSLWRRQKCHGPISPELPAPPSVATIPATFRGRSSIGRAPRLQRGGCRFEPGRLQFPAILETRGEAVEWRQATGDGRGGMMLGMRACLLSEFPSRGRPGGRSGCCSLWRC